MNTRYFGLDFARAVLMLLGIFYHASLIYIVDGQWHVSHTEHNAFFNLLTDFIHYFRMDAFYIIAGFFFVLVVEKYGIGATLRERIIKLGVPLLVVGFSLNAYLSRFHPEFAATGSWAYIVQGQWLHHLWFIGNLILYYVLAMGFVERFTTAKTKPHSMKTIAMMALLVTPTLWIVLTWIGVRVEPQRLLFLSFEGALGYFPYFVLGMYFWGQREQCFKVMTPRNATVLSLAALVITIVMQTVDLKAISWSLYLLVNGYNGAILAIAMIMWLNYIGRKANPLISKLTASSYTVYLLHEPLIVFVYVTLLASLSVNLFVSFALLCAIVFAVTYFSHFWLFNKSNLLMLLFNGKLPKPAKLDKPAGASSMQASR